MASPAPSPCPPPPPPRRPPPPPPVPPPGRRTRLRQRGPRPPGTRGSKRRRGRRRRGPPTGPLRRVRIGTSSLLSLRTPRPEGAPAPLGEAPGIGQAVVRLGPLPRRQIQRGAQASSRRDGPALRIPGAGANDGLPTPRLHDLVGDGVPVGHRHAVEHPDDSAPARPDGQCRTTSHLPGR